MIPDLMDKELLIATDFSGLGSPEEALKRLKVNFKSMFACDKDKYAKASYLANHKTEIFYDDIVEREQKNAPGSDLYVFGFPCQAFSIAGNRKGFEDTRGTLFFNAFEYLSEHKPRVFIAENVKGLLSHDKSKGSKSKYGKTFGVIRDALALTINGQQNLYKYEDCLNYHIYFQVLNSKEYGIPQNRERIFIVGFRDEEDSKRFKFPKKTPLILKLKDLVEKNVDEKYYLSEAALRRILRKGNYVPKIDPEVTGTINTKNNSGQLSMDNGTTLISDELQLANPRTRIVKSTDSILIDEVEEVKIGAIRGRNIVDGKRKDYRGAPTQQRLEINENDISNCLTSVQKDNMVVEYNKAELIPMFGTENNGRATRIYNDKGIAVTQSANGGGLGEKTGLYLIAKRIRRLTPREVFRLMGYSDEFFERCASINSDTQLYKQGGNSIVVDTIMHLLIQILTALKIPFTWQQ